MHFFYLDESGCTGTDLTNQQQPIFVLGGVSIRDESWRGMQEAFQRVIANYFNGRIPEGFELHAGELLSPDGDGPFAGHERERRNGLTLAILNLLEKNSHHVHFIALSKQRMAAANYGEAWARVPYILAFDYMTTYVNWLVRSKLGRSARGMIIFDEKEQFSDDIERISRIRRFAGAAVHRVKFIVEFAYPIDSFKNPMIQVSDVITFCVRKFLEVEEGFHAGWPQGGKEFFARCYDKIDARVRRKDLVERREPGSTGLNDYVSAIRSRPVGNWRKRYAL
jgi:hypothetical protein